MYFRRTPSSSKNTSHLQRTDPLGSSAPKNEETLIFNLRSRRTKQPSIFNILSWTLTRFPGLLRFDSQTDLPARRSVRRSRSAIYSWLLTRVYRGVHERFIVPAIKTNISQEGPNRARHKRGGAAGRRVAMESETEISAKSTTSRFRPLRTKASILNRSYYDSVTNCRV